MESKDEFTKEVTELRLMTEELVNIVIREINYCERFSPQRADFLRNALARVAEIGQREIH